MSKTKEELLLDYAKFGDLDNLQKLLEENINLDINTQGEDGNTPLMFAVQEDNKATAKLLMEHGANVSIKNSFDADVFDIMQEMAGDNIDYDYDDMNAILMSSPKLEEFISKKSRSSSISSLSSNGSTTELASYNKESSVNDIVQRLKTMSPSEIIQLRDSLPKNIADSLLGEKTIEATARPISIQPESSITTAKVEIGSPVQEIRTVEGLRPAVISKKPIPSPPPLPGMDLFAKQPKILESTVSGLTTETQSKSREEGTEETKTIKVAGLVAENKAKLLKFGNSMQAPAGVLNLSISLEPVADTINLFNTAIVEQKISDIAPLVKRLASSTDSAAITALEDGLVKLIEISPSIWQAELDNIKVTAQACKIEKDKIDNIELLKNKVLKIYSKFSAEELTSLYDALTEEQRQQYKITSIEDALPIQILMQNRQSSFSPEEQQILTTLSPPTPPAKYGSGIQKTEDNIDNQFNNLGLSVEKTLAIKATELHQKVDKAKTAFQALRSAAVAIKGKIGIPIRVATALDETKRDPEVVRVKNEFTNLLNSNIDYSYKDASTGKTESIKKEASTALLPSIDIAKVFTSALKVVTTAPVAAVTQKAPTFSTTHIEVNPLITELADANNKRGATRAACQQAVPKIQRLQQLDKILEENNLVSTQLKAYIQEVAIHFAKAADPGAVASIKPVIMMQAKRNPVKPLNLSAEEARDEVITELKLAGLAEDEIKIITTEEYNLKMAQKEARSVANAALSAGTKHTGSPTKKALVTPDALTSAKLRSSTPDRY